MTTLLVAEHDGKVLKDATSKAAIVEKTAISNNEKRVCDCAAVTKVSIGRIWLMNVSLPIPRTTSRTEAASAAGSPSVRNAHHDAA